MFETKPGGLWHGGSWGWRNGSCLPWDDVPIWEEAFGWENQYHLMHVNLGFAHQPDMIVPFLRLGKQIVEGGGMVQYIVVGTPPELATMPVGYVDPWSHRESWFYYRPSDEKRWADDYFMPFLEAVHKKIGLERTRISIWHEPNLFCWRNAILWFFRLYDATQVAVKRWEKTYNTKANIGGIQLANLDDERGYGPNDPPFITVPTMDFTEDFLEHARKKEWQIDFFDLFKYSGTMASIPTTISLINQYTDVVRAAGYGETEIVFNAISHCGMNYDNPPLGAIDPWSLTSAKHSYQLCKQLSSRTEVVHGGFDFIEDSEWPGSQHGYRGNGLLEYETKRKRPRWDAVRDIYGELEKVGVDRLELSDGYPSF